MDKALTAKESNKDSGVFSTLEMKCKKSNIDLFLQSKLAFLIRCPFCSRINKGSLELQKISREKFFITKLDDERCKCGAIIGISIVRVGKKRA